MPAGHEVVGEPALRVEARVRLGDDELPLLDRGEVLDLVGDEAVAHLAVRGLEEAVLVGPGIDGERVDETDVGAFRGLDRADPAVVGRMDVAHLEARPLPGEARPAPAPTPAVCG